jgi:hypothetical protein
MMFYWVMLPSVMLPSVVLPSALLRHDSCRLLVGLPSKPAGLPSLANCDCQGWQTVLVILAKLQLFKD